MSSNRPRALVPGAALVMVVAISVIGWLGRISLLDACFLAVFALMQPAIGSIFLLLIHRMTGGQWGRLLLPQLHAGAMLAPWIWLLLLPFLFLENWPAGETHDADGSLAVYMGAPMQGLRFGVIWFALFLLARGLRRSGRETRAAWIGPAGFIGLTFLLHLAAVDWLFTLKPDWYSSGFPLVWMAGHVVSALAAALAYAVLTGARPSASGSSHRPEGIDWGNLLMAAVLFWSYLAFTHFLIMWMGDVSRELAWYTQRATTTWEWIIGVLAAFHLGLPLLLLFFRAFKQSAAGLCALAIVLIVLQGVHTAWIILPSLGTSGPPLTLAVAMAAAAMALFFSIYARLARRLGES